MNIVSETLHPPTLFTMDTSSETTDTFVL